MIPAGNYYCWFAQGPLFQKGSGPMCVQACVCALVCVTCETTSLSQQECAPGHEEEKRRLQQLEISQLGELCHVQSVKEFNTTIQVELFH